MMKEEFVRRVNDLGNPLRFEDLPQEDYDIIEYVYNYHPSIYSRNDIAHLFCLRGGFQIIKDMVRTAEEWEQKEQQRAGLDLKDKMSYEQAVDCLRTYVQVYFGFDDGDPDEITRDEADAFWEESLAKLKKEYGKA